jgi:membrane protease YdiL (CAAX protease family)
MVWVPQALASSGIISFPLDPGFTDWLGVFGPFLAALIMTGLYDGRAGIRGLFKRLLKWRVGVQWYLFVLFWPPLLSLAKTAIAMLLGSGAPDFSQPPFVRLSPLPPELLKSLPFLVFLPFLFFQQTLIGSSMGEEIGWRGYALPRLQTIQGNLRGSILLGILWGIWHLPLWMTKGNAMQGKILLWPLLELIATSVLFTWVYNNTKGSLLLALLFHTSIAMTSLFLSSLETYPIVSVILSWMIAGLIIYRSRKALSPLAVGAQDHSTLAPF